MATIPGLYLRGTRVGFRPLELDDLERCYTWLNDWEILRYVSHMLPKSREQERAWLARERGNDDFPLALVLLEDGTHIGNGGIHAVDWANRHGTAGLIIGAKGAQNHGYGREAEELLLDFAFRRLNLNRVEAEVHSDNPRSLKVAERVGMVIEGRRRERLLRNGAFVDDHIVGMLASEWFARHPEPVAQ